MASSTTNVSSVAGGEKQFRDAVLWYEKVMGGCTNCSGKAGCDDRKGEMVGGVQSWLETLYPSKRWGEIDDEAVVAQGIRDWDIEHLADELGTTLKGVALVQEGDEEDLCDFIYILCQGREPCVLQNRLAEVPVSEEIQDAESISELYLRVSISRVAPLAVVQELQVKLRQEEGVAVVQENLAAGVYSAPLLKRFQRLVAILPSYGIEHVDMGEISQAPKGYDEGLYSELFGCAPHEVNYLFYRHPSTMTAVYQLFDTSNRGQDRLVAL